MSETLVVVVPDADILASTVAARLVVRIIDAQAARGSASVVLTGGRVAAKVLRQLGELPAAAAIDWSRVDLWWGDERFLPAGDPDRNETQAREAVLDALPLDPARVHAMPATDGPDGDDADAAAARYAAEVTAAGAHFDVLMLGVGEDGHVASLFPGHPVLAAQGVAVATYDSPKPPPTRITLTLDTIRRAGEVWLVAAGPDKAEPIGAALRGADLPAAHAVGVHRTLFLLDQAAAAKR
ncbi:6-phosphogluconolactonase [Actinoplanes sp. SE50]|uniref:6-phosphogluconolactonase n=1 Tax=unclassified Actinoplanes TaxID=2626549 RepID=UPI00023ED1D4|nr:MULTISPECIES: 6-phosphogluconolactonase [unclassified Actinoplanes]AEV82758.1 6-phosphogluconolactonase [Actinoplanes sp. SE50/110]ATO81154.1 6-phosphogluconolactonase [Actinoplanes sp. SE50]SLL98561.1 6-phosphogluconolactonase [Actinoplanes sp. SE50/110]